jgi:hypothetical protein
MAFGYLAAGLRYAARFAAYTHVQLRIEISADPVAEQRLLV